MKNCHALLATCTLAGASMAAGTDDPPPNVLLVVIDDLGTDRLNLTTDYAPGSPYAPTSTPYIDALAAGGVLFTNAYANPICAPTRAMLMTGRYGFRTGIGEGIQIDDDENNGLSIQEVLLPEMLKDSGLGYSTAVFGKWHLGRTCHLAVVDALGVPDPLGHRGVDRFIGTFSNFPGGQHYMLWPEIDQPVPGGGSDCATIDQETTHCTEANVDNALAWIAAQTEPWFCMVSFQAVHGKLQWPGYGPYPDGPPLPPNTPSEALAYLDAMTRHTDRHIGELLANIDPNTFVFLMSDNGTQSADTGVAQTMFPPYEPSHDKGTIYEHGVRVPLIVSGPGISPGVSDALVSLVDVYRTVAALVGIQALPQTIAADSVSFADVLLVGGPGARETVFCERFSPNNPTSPVESFARSVREETFKLVRRYTALPIPSTTHELYDIVSDPYERKDLIAFHGGAQFLPLEAGQAYLALTAELDATPLP